MFDKEGYMIGIGLIDSFIYRKNHNIGGNLMGAKECKQNKSIRFNI